MDNCNNCILFSHKYLTDFEMDVNINRNNVSYFDLCGLLSIHCQQIYLLKNFYCNARYFHNPLPDLNLIIVVGHLSQNAKNKALLKYVSLQLLFFNHGWYLNYHNYLKIKIWISIFKTSNVSNYEYQLD